MFRLFLFLFFFTSLGFCPPRTNRIIVEEEDGAPSVVSYLIKVSNGVLTDNGDGTASLSSGGVTDHGALTGLADDDHTQYVLKTSSGKQIGITVDGGGSAVSTGIKGYFRVNYAGTIQGVTILADVSGSVVVDIWKDTLVNYPPTDADSITSSAAPTLTAATNSEDTTLTGWTTSFSSGDVFGFNVDSATTVTRIHVILDVDVT